MRRMIQQISTIAWMTFREALYSKLLWAGLIGILLILAAAEFVSDVVVTGAAQLQVGVLAWGLRWFGALILVLFCVSSVVRDSSDKTIDMLLALPMRRSVFYVGRLVGFLLLALGFSAISAVASSIFSPITLSVLWAMSQFFELAVLCSFALWVAMSTESAVGTSVVTLGFYLLSRAMLGIESMASGPFFQPDSAYDQFVAVVVTVLGWVLPPLYDFASADWLINGVIDADLLLQFGKASLYVVLLTSIAMIEMYRKQY